MMSIEVCGTCGNCGGRVTKPTNWMGIYPPKPTCERCGAEAIGPEDTVLPMGLPKKPEELNWFEGWKGVNDDTPPSPLESA